MTSRLATITWSGSGDERQGAQRGLGWSELFPPPPWADRSSGSPASTAGRSALR